MIQPCSTSNRGRDNGRGSGFSVPGLVFPDWWFLRPKRVFGFPGVLGSRNGVFRSHPGKVYISEGILHSHDSFLESLQLLLESFWKVM